LSNQVCISSSEARQSKQKSLGYWKTCLLDFGGAWGLNKLFCNTAYLASPLSGEQSSTYLAASVNIHWGGSKLEDEVLYTEQWRSLSTEKESEGKEKSCFRELLGGGFSIIVLNIVS
jgi:hypothetical protein